ncbi:MAG TPA: GWxTD domain-containing protein, partial [Terriglobales bacterium]|nr:GWxTD domain-containing protein [Terriglobales bacterium]
MPADGFRRTVLATIVAGSFLLGGMMATAQDSKTDSDNNLPANSSLTAKDPKSQNQEDPLKRPVSTKQRKRNEKALHQELSKTYKKWLDEDVRWIITDQEREAFLKLSNDEERDQFIEQFWQRRNPTPDSVDNPYKDEHYRRIAYANEHFAAGIPGWKTDRGRMYIMYGPADEVESHPAGGTYDR